MESEAFPWLHAQDRGEAVFPLWSLALEVLLTALRGPGCPWGPQRHPFPEAECQHSQGNCCLLPSSLLLSLEFKGVSKHSASRCLSLHLGWHLGEARGTQGHYRRSIGNCASVSVSRLVGDLGIAMGCPGLLRNGRASWGTLSPLGVKRVRTTQASWSHGSWREEHRVSQSLVSLGRCQVLGHRETNILGRKRGSYSFVSKRGF